MPRIVLFALGIGGGAVAWLFATPALVGVVWSAGADVLHRLDVDLSPLGGLEPWILPAVAITILLATFVWRTTGASMRQRADPTLVKTRGWSATSLGLLLAIGSAAAFAVVYVFEQKSLLPMLVPYVAAAAVLSAATAVWVFGAVIVWSIARKLDAPPDRASDPRVATRAGVVLGILGAIVAKPPSLVHPMAALEAAGEELSTLETDPRPPLVDGLAAGDRIVFASAKPAEPGGACLAHFDANGQCGKAVESARTKFRRSQRWNVGEDDFIHDAQLATCAQWPANACAYFTRIIQNCLRNTRCYRPVPSTPGACDFDPEIPRDPGGDPTDEAHRRDCVRRVNAWLCTQSVEIQVAVSMRAVDEASFAEVGASIGKSAEAARKTYDRATAALRQEFPECSP